MIPTQHHLQFSASVSFSFFKYFFSACRLTVPPLFFFSYLCLFTCLLVLFLPALGFHCCARLYLIALSRAPLYLQQAGLLLAVASLVAEHGLQSTRASVFVARGLSCSEACGILVRRPGMETMSAVLAGRFLTTGPSGKTPASVF